MGPKSGWGGGDRLCQTSPIPRSPDGDNNDAEVVVALEAGADVDARDKDHRTPLQLAAKHSKSAVFIKALVECGADVDACDYNERTPLHLAVHYNPPGWQRNLCIGLQRTIRLRRSVLCSKPAPMSTSWTTPALISVVGCKFQSR